MKFLSKKLTSLVMLATISVSIVNPITAYAYDKSKTAHMLGNGHIDVAWEWRIEETIRECEATFGRAIKNLEKFDDYRYSQSQAQLYAYTEEYYPELFEKIKNQVDNGKWDITGGQMVEPDLNLASGEALVRQSLYGQKYFKDKFDKRATVGWVPDTFGFTYNFPQILKGSGMDYFITTKLNWNETNKWPHEVFNWKSPDGSEVLAYKPTSDYVWNGSALGNKSSYDAIMDQQAKKGLSTSIALYGAGDHGGGPNENDINYIKSVDSDETAMNIEMSMADDAFKALEVDIENSGTSEIATIDNELYFEKHRGTYTTGGAIKKYNRLTEIEAEVSEKYATLAYLLNAVDYPIEKIEQAWKIITLNQFHDILPGSSIHSVYLDAYNDAEIALNLLNAVKEDALAALAARVKTNTVKEGIPIVLFNSLSWDRNEYVEQEIIFDKEISNIEIQDSEGNPVESELVSVDGKIAKVLFKAEIPAIGYSTYTAVEKESDYKVNDGVVASEEDYTLENKFFKLQLNPETGNIKSIIDKKNGNKEVLEEGKEANEFNILEDTPVYWEAWDVDMDDMNKEAQVINGLKDIELINSSETKSTFRVTREWGNSQYFSDITLYSDEDRIDIKTGVNWNEEQKILKVAFPLSVNPEKATYEIAYGTVNRDTSWENRTEGAQFEVSGHKWADMTEGDYGVSILNDSKYGWDTLDNRIRLTLLRSTMSRAGESDRGRYHEINYSIYPHIGSFSDAETVKESYNFNYKIDSIQTKKHDGELESTKSFAKTNKKNIIISALKRAEDGEEVVVRLYEADGLENTEAEITLPGEIEYIEEVNLLEDKIEDEKEIKTSGNSFTTSFKKHEIKSFKVKLKEIEGAKDTKVKSYPINLEEEYNLDGISTDGNRNDGNYAGNGESLAAEIIPKSIVSEGVNFNFGSKEDGRKNIVQAKGQEIKLPNESHEALYLLGNSAGAGAAEGVFRVNYTDGSYEEKYLSFTSWKDEIGSFLNTNVKSTIGLHLTHTHTPKGNTLDIDNNMFVYSIKLDNTKKVESIVMPSSEAIKVSAMSFADSIVDNQKDTEAPTRVEGLDVVTPFKKYSDYVDLSWEEANDNIKVEKYNIYRATKSDKSDAKLIATTDKTEYRDSMNGTPNRYYYFIKAEDREGNTGEPSEVLSASLGNNISKNANVTADDFITDQENPSKLVDGDYSTKWCSIKRQNHWAVIDLGKEQEIGSVVIKHAATGGEDAVYNTSDFKLYVSSDNKNWTLYDDVVGNKDNITTHTKDAKGRYVKIVTTKPQQNGGSGVRIYEMEVLAKGTNDVIEEAPSTVTTINSISRGYKNITLEFDKVENTESYKILYGNINNEADIKVMEVTETRATINDLELGNEYFVKVIPTNFYGEGPVSEVRTVKTYNENIVSKDLSEYFNLDGIANASGNKADGNFDEAGWSYDGDLLQDPLAFKDTSFKLGSKVDGDKNVIKAQGQEINLGDVNASSIYLLGTAHDGTQKGIYKVNYTDGTSSEHMVEMSDWCGKSLDNHNEMLVIENPHRIYNGKGNEEAANIDKIKVSLNMYPISINPEKKVKSITFPDNGKIKLFAMNVGEVEAKEPEEIVVSKPQELKANEVTNNTVNLEWKSPIEEVGLVGYEIYKDGKLVSEVNKDTTNITINELRKNTIYGFKVISKYSNGEKSKSISLNIRTKS